MHFLDQAVSRVLGAVKFAKGAVEGLSGVFTTLMEEHGEVRALMLRVKSSDDLDLRRELWPKIRVELLAHEKGERDVVYPALREHEQTACFVEEHDREADDMRVLIAELQGLDYGDARWGERFERLADLVQEHVMREESEYFPTARRVLGEQSARLGRRYAEVKEAALASLRA